MLVLVISALKSKTIKILHNLTEDMIIGNKKPKVPCYNFISFLIDEKNSRCHFLIFKNILNSLLPRYNRFMNSASVQSAVAEEVNSRLAKATQDIQDKYELGNGGVESSVDGPTGEVYKEKYLQEQRDKNSKKKASAAKAKENSKNKLRDDDEEEDDGNDAGGEDEDYELRQLREQRLRKLKQSHREKIENIAKGHGDFREIEQDQFLSEVTSSEKVICLFYHRDFSRCTIMEHHLKKLSSTHIETKFVKINAEKALFFVEKVKTVLFSFLNNKNIDIRILL
jgi:hypothetical protein